MMKQVPTNVQIPGEFNDDEDFWPHEICKNYEANRNAVVRNKFTKNIVGKGENKNGYYIFACANECCKVDRKQKDYYKHRFIFECFHGLIKDGYVIDHVDNDKTNNKLDNLQMITQKENSKKNNAGGIKRLPQKIKAINLETGELFIYRSIYGAGKDLHINEGCIFRVLNGTTKTALSKKLNQRFTFRKVEYDIAPVIIINNNYYNIKINTAHKVKIPLSHIKKMNLNNN